MTTLLLALAISHVPSQGVDVLSKVRTALRVSHSADSQADIVLAGFANYCGIVNTYELRFEENGEFRQSISGALGKTFGCDGTNYWEVDASGAPRRLAFEDIDRTDALVFLLTDHWLDTVSPVELIVENGGKKKGTYSIRLKTHRSGFEEVIHIDGKTWLPTVAEFSIAASKTTISLWDWQNHGSRKLPCRVEVTEQGLTDEYIVTTSKLEKASPQSVFEIPEGGPTNFSYDSTLPAAVETKRAESGHLLVHPRINGKDVGWFILDSGADTMIVDKKIADSISLPQIGREAVMGVGGAVQEPFRTISKFTLGPAEMRDTNFIEFDLGGLSAMFKVKLGGIIGFDFFRRFIIQVDLAKPLVQVNRVDDFHLPQGEWSNMLFSSGNPVVTASFEGDHKGWFRLDTGANGKVVFHSPVVEKLKMLDGRTTTPVGMAGVGGTTDARLGKLSWFMLGGHRFENVEAVFSEAKVGAFADTYLTGNIGQDLMEPFTVVFDFGGSRVAFLPH